MAVVSLASEHRSGTTPKPRARTHTASESLLRGCSDDPSGGSDIDRDGIQHVFVGFFLEAIGDYTSHIVSTRVVTPASETSSSAGVRDGLVASDTSTAASSHSHATRAALGGVTCAPDTVTPAAAGCDRDTVAGSVHGTAVVGSSGGSCGSSLGGSGSFGCGSQAGTGVASSLRLGRGTMSYTVSLQRIDEEQCEGTGGPGDRIRRRLLKLRSSGVGGLAGSRRSVRHSAGHSDAHSDGTRAGFSSESCSDDSHSDGNDSDVVSVHSDCLADLGVDDGDSTVLTGSRHRQRGPRHVAGSDSHGAARVTVTDAQLAVGASLAAATDTPTSTRSGRTPSHGGAARDAGETDSVSEGDESEVLELVFDQMGCARAKPAIAAFVTAMLSTQMWCVWPLTSTPHVKR